MADISDVESSLCNVIEAAVYPGGTSANSVTGSLVKIYRGWPNNRALNADLANGYDTITVFSREHSTRDTSRYGRRWQTVADYPATLTVSVSGNKAVFGGLGGAGQTVTLIVDGVGYSYIVKGEDTPATVCEALCLVIPNTIANGNQLAIDCRRLIGRVVGSGRSIMETRRQEQGIMVSIWSATPTGRDVISSIIDVSLSGIDWLVLADGTSGRLLYKETLETDVSENANLYRRSLDYSVEYATTVSETTSQMALAVGTFSGSGATVGFGCLEPRDHLIVPPIGVVRFDAWYDPNNTIDLQCAAALSPVQYQYRLPSNASVIDGTVVWPRATQATMDAEIIAAANAGIQFWAFDSYQPDDSLSLALELYLTSSLRTKVGFCMLGQTSNWGENGLNQPSLLRDINMMTQTGYQTVLDGRPLYLVLDSSADQMAGLPAGGVAKTISLVRQNIQNAGGKNPYVVWLSGAALADYSNVVAAQNVGADAAGAYAVPRLNGSHQTYGALALAAVTDWKARGASGFPMIPTAMSGWDQRPLVQNKQNFYPVPSSLSMDNYYDGPSSQELGSHVVDLANFVIEHPSACEAQIGLIYAWNELAEGGWIMPTYTPDGPDTNRCSAIGAALSKATANSTKPTISLIA